MLSVSLISNDGILGGHVACLLLGELDGGPWRATIHMSPELKTVIAREQARDCTIGLR